MSRVLVVEDDRFLREQMAWALQAEHAVLQASTRDEGLRMALRDRPDLVLLDLHLPPDIGRPGGLELLREIRQRGLDALVIIMTGDDKKELALRAMDDGAYDFFRKPVDLTELKVIIRRALERQAIERENRQLRQRLAEDTSLGRLIGRSPAMKRVFDSILRVAPTDTTVIIRGESGAGKDLAARAIHDASRRKDGPFVPVQCSALPESLFESELFGAEKGAYTGAVAARQGRLEVAHGGTLFLDEIGTTPPSVQAKLLRVLEQKRFERLGGRATIQADVRLVTATNEDLEARIRDGTFREDLYYRINVFPITLPPLRERPEDIPLLVEHFLRVYGALRGVSAMSVSPEAMDILTRHPWKGNVRELENLVQTLALWTDETTIAPSDLPPHVRSGGHDDEAHGHPLPGRPIVLSEEVDRYEARLIRLALASAGGVKIEAARLLGIDKNRMMYLCRKYRLQG